MKSSYKSGFVALIGRPNVGKSTLINKIIGQKIAITSDKRQTTRQLIQGIYTDEEAQIIFVDTPGIHRPRHKLGSFMVNLAEDTLKDTDLVLFMINAEERIGPGDRFIINLLKKIKTPVFLLINKVDLISEEDIFPLIETYSSHYSFDEIIPISSLEGNNVNKLLELIKNYLEEGPKYYEADQITNHSEKFLIEELIREKVLNLTREEVPHSIAVKIDSMEEKKNNTTYIQATIFTERPTQRGILIGKGGSMLKEVGTQARKEIAEILGGKVYLDLWIKVEKDWRNNKHKLNRFGFRPDDY